MNKEHRDPNNIDLEAPRLAWYKHKRWKKHQITVYWVDIKLAQKKGLKFYQTRSNAIILYNALPAYCIAKAVRMETEEIIYEKVFASPRPPPKISLRNEWMKELDSEVARQAQDHQPTQLNPNPIYRTVRPAVRGKKRPVRVLRKSIHVSLLTARMPLCLLNVQRKTKTQTKT